MTMTLNGTGTTIVDVNGNVGIGTNSPSSKLSIANTTGNPAYIEVAGNGNTVGSTSALFGQDGSNYAYCWNRANQAILFGTNNIERMRIDTSGNVGIGTSSPTTKFTVASASDGKAVNLVNGSGNTSLIQFGSNSIPADAYTYIKADGRSTGYLTVSTNDTERMRITSNGGVSFGSSGTAYGTSGQVLQSNGDAAPTWVTASGGVTSLNGQTGAITDTNLYAIGSYVIGRPQNLTTSYAVNTTIAGSTLYATGSLVYWDGGQWWIPSVGAITSGGPTLVNTGTWRCVSPAAIRTNISGCPGLWVRIS